MGNHDAGSSAYSQHFQVPNVSSLGMTEKTGKFGGDYWYTYNNVLFMSLNSNNMSTAEHREFMKTVLEENGADADWTVVTFHHSIYSTASHESDNDIIQRRAELAPVFTELGIDVVLMGHDHVYTRSYMMDGLEPMVEESTDETESQSVKLQIRPVLFILLPTLPAAVSIMNSLRIWREIMWRSKIRSMCPISLRLMYLRTLSELPHTEPQTNLL